MFLAAKMNHASVAMLLLGAGRSAAVIGQLGQMLAQRAAVHEMMEITEGRRIRDDRDHRGPPCTT